MLLLALPLLFHSSLIRRKGGGSTHAVLSSIAQLAVLYSNSSEKPNSSGCWICFPATTTTFMRCMNKILYVSPRNIQTSQFFQLLQLIYVLFCLQRTFLPKIYCIYRIRYNDRQLFVYVTNNVRQDFPRICSSPRLICSKIFWSVDAMDAKFCIKGACLSSCFRQLF